jgi:hypothetical protein
MLTIHTLDGFKYFNIDPEQRLLIQPPYPEEWLRDNFLYISLTFHDWQAGLNTLRFIFRAHHPGWMSGLKGEKIIDAISQWVRDNQTPRLYVILWQNSSETNDEFRFSIDTVEPLLELRGETVSAAEYLRQKQSFYATLKDRIEEAHQRQIDLRKQEARKKSN